MRSVEQKLLNAVQRPEACREVVLRSAGTRIVLSVWDAPAGAPVVRDGSITCPVTVLTGRGDPLFPLAHTREVFSRVVAPHLLFNEDLTTVLPPLLQRLEAVVPAERGAPP